MLFRSYHKLLPSSSAADAPAVVIPKIFSRYIKLLLGSYAKLGTSKDGFNDDETYNTFIEEVNSQNAYNNVGGSAGGYKINAIPLITYHNVDYLTGSYHTDVDLFAQEMKYLHDNGFRVLTMRDLGYDDSTNSLYLVNAPRPS